MRLIVVIACIILAATAVVAQEDPCVAELARCRDACGNREILVNDCASASGFLSKACSCGGALDAPAGEEGAIETTSETVYFDGGAMAMHGSEDAQETKVRKRPEEASSAGNPPGNTRARRFFFPSASPARREPWTDPPALSPSPQAKKPCPHHESMSMEPALMFNRRFGPGFASLFDELFDETEADGGWTTPQTRPAFGRGDAGPGVSVSFGPGLGVFGNARQQMMFNAFQPRLVFRAVFMEPEPRPLLFDLEHSDDSDLGSMDPSARTESVMSALQRWRDVSDVSGAARWTAKTEGLEGSEDGGEGGGARAMEVNREAMAETAGRRSRRDPEDEGGAMRRLVLAFASVALIAAVLTLTSAALVCVASLATRAFGRMFRRRGRDSGLAVDAVDASEPLLLEYETTRVERAVGLSTVYADAAPAAPTPRRASSVEDETMEVMMPMPLERGDRSTWRSEPGYIRL